MIARKLLGLLAIALLAIACGCTNKELCFDHSHVAEMRVKFNWKNAPEANPGGMTVFFYNRNGYVRRFDLQGREGGTVRVPIGMYDIVAYNNDLQNTQAFGADAFGSHGLRTSECSVLEPMSLTGLSEPAITSNERVVAAADMIWCAIARGVEIKEAEVSGEREIILEPERLVAVYTVEVRGIKGLERVEDISGSLTGLSGSVTLDGWTLSAERVTVPFAFEKVGDDMIRGRFCVFGHPEDCREGHRLLLYLWMKSGHKFMIGRDSERFDVASQIHGASDSRNVNIVIDGVTMPQPIGEGGGFIPSVDDWIEVDIGIEI